MSQHCIHHANRLKASTGQSNLEGALTACEHVVAKEYHEPVAERWLAERKDEVAEGWDEGAAYCTQTVTGDWLCLLQETSMPFPCRTQTAARSCSVQVQPAALPATSR